jgi:single-stranded-DNA-specific exonuclease
MIGRAEIEPQLTIDSYINLSDIDLNFADDISRLAPFGNGNPSLTLATKNVHIKSRRTLGSRGDHLQLTLEDEAGNSQKVVWWFGDVEALPQGNFDIAYTVRANVFNGKREALVEWIDARPYADSGLAISDAPQVKIMDYRGKSLENALQEFPEALIFAEGENIPNSVDRFHLYQSDTLLLWTMPPSPSDWQAILNLTQPQRVLMFGKYPRFASTQDFVTHLIGMAKFAQKNREGIISMDDFVRSTAQTVLTVQAGLRWIEAHTALQFTSIDEDTYSVINEAGDSPITSTDWAQLLAQRLQETEAYRQWWAR